MTLIGDFILSVDDPRIIMHPCRGGIGIETRVHDNRVHDNWVHDNRVHDNRVHDKKILTL